MRSTRTASTIAFGVGLGAVVGTVRRYDLLPLWALFLLVFAAWLAFLYHRDIARTQGED